MLVSCEGGDLRPTPDGVWVHGHESKSHVALTRPAVPRSEVVDELVGALRDGVPPLHDGAWARSTLEVCLAVLRSADENRDIELIPAT